MNGPSPDMRLITGQAEPRTSSESGQATGPLPAPSFLLERVSALRAELDLLIERMDEMEQRFHELDALNAYTEESAAYRLDQARQYTHRDY